MKITENSKKTLYLILGLLLLSICSLTIVYAAMSAVLRISGNSEVSASNWDIHLANPSVKSGSVHNNLPTISGNSLSFNATLSLPGDYYEFNVDVVNEGTIDAMIDSVSITPELSTEQARYIKYEVSYQNGESISSKQTLKKGTTTPIKVRIEYRNDINASDLPSSETNLSLKVTLLYIQSDGTGSDIPNDGAEASLVRVVSGDGTQVGNEVCIKNECFYVISSTDTTVTMLSKYNLYVGNSVDEDLIVTPLASPTGIQDNTAKGYDLDNENGVEVYPFIGTTAFSNSRSVYSGSIVEGYVNNYNSYLITQGVSPVEARLISKDELIGLGCSEDDNSCSEAPSWVYAISYWSGSAFATYHVWSVNSNANFVGIDCSSGRYFGVRPVITISRDYL